MHFTQDASEMLYRAKLSKVQSFVITGEGKKTQILEFEKVTLEDIQKKLRYIDNLEILKKRLG